MKVKILVNTDFDPLQKAINEFIKNKKIVNIKFTTDSLDLGRNVEVLFSALIMYEEITQIKQKSFGNLASDKDINSFTEKHDVVRIERFQNEDTDVNTIVTYRE